MKKVLQNIVILQNTPIFSRYICPLKTIIFEKFQNPKSLFWTRFGLNSKSLRILNPYICLVFENFQNIVPNLDWLENKYLYLPINTHISKNQIETVISIFNEVVDQI